MESRSTRVGRERILETAEELFTQHGYRAVSIRDIARNCHLTSAALYYHFPSKELLYHAVLERHAENLSARMRAAALTPGSYRDRATAMLWEYSQVAAERRSPVFLLRRDKLSLEKTENQDQHSRLMHALLWPLEDLIGKAVQTGEIHSLPSGYSAAALLVGMLHGQALYRQTCLDMRLERQDVELVVKMFWQGLSSTVENP